MINELFLELNNIKWFLVAEIVTIALLYGFYSLLTKKFVWQKSKLLTFGLLYNLNKNQVIVLGLCLSRILFVLFSSIFCMNINIGYLIVLETVTLIILFIDKDVKAFFSNLFTYGVIFVLLFIQNALYNYYYEVDNDWIVMFMLVMIGIFVVLTTFINTINSYNRLLEKKELVHD